MINVDELNKNAYGKWLGIFESLGIKVPLPPGNHGFCPICNDGKDRFRLDKTANNDGGFFCNQCQPKAGHGVSLVQRCLGLTFPETLHRINELVGSIEFEPIKNDNKPDPSIRLREIWKNSFPLNGKDLASKYLRSRGLILETQNLLYCDECYEPETKSKMPAMIGVIQNHQNEYIGLHRTFLDLSGGRANIKSQKKLMPPKKPLAGSAIRIFPAKEFVGVAEGIETAIAASQLFEIPVWACISSTLLESFEPPAGIRNITIFGDNDVNFAGQKAAYRLANRLYLKDLIVSVEIPNNPGDDWADVLVRNINKNKD